MTILKSKTFNNLSLSKEYFYFAAIVTTLIISSLLWLLWYSYTNLEKTREHRYILEANRIESTLDDSFLYITNFVKFIGQKISSLDSPNAKNIASLLQTKVDTSQIKENILPWTLFEFVDSNGYAIASTLGISQPPLKVDTERRSWIKTARSNPWTLKLSEPDIGIVSGEYIIPGGYGITGSNGEFLGIISIGFNINKLKKKIQSSLISKQTQFIVLTEIFKIIVSSSNDKDSLNNLVKSLKISGLNKTYSNKLPYIIKQDNIVYRHYKITKPYNYIILVGETNEFMQEELEQLVVPQIIKTLVLGIAFLILLYFFRIKVVNPMRLLSERAKMLSQGNLDIEMPKVNSSEAAALVEALEMVKGAFQREYLAQAQLAEANLRINSINVELENKVKIRTADLEKALASKTEFLNNMSHEIRTPVQGFTIISEGLVEHWSSFDDDKKLTFATQIASSAKRLAALLNNLLDLSKFNADKMLMYFHQMDLNLTIDNIIEECNILYLNKKSVKIEFNRSENAHLIGDEERIGQVLRNLFINAIKFSKNDSIIITSLENTNEGLHFTITDKGIGIPINELEAIFDPFTQNTRTKTTAGGTGLGLSICKQIIEAHNGKIWAVNNLKVGSSFHFIIPTTQSGNNNII